MYCTVHRISANDMIILLMHFPFTHTHFRTCCTNDHDKEYDDNGEVYENKKIENDKIQNLLISLFNGWRTLNPDQKHIQ